MLCNKSVLYQYIGAICSNLITIAYGAALAWPSASFLVLQSHESPLNSGKITVEEASWIGAMIAVGGFFGNIIFGRISDFIGRKKALIIVAIPQIANWLLIIFATNPIYLYIARLLAGLAGGGALVLVPIYTAEISEDSVRGELLSFLMLFCNIGILFAYILGNFLSYIAIPSVSLVFPVIFLVSTIFLPESPHFLIKKYKEQKAIKSLQYFRNMKKIPIENSIYLQKELEKLKQEIFDKKLKKKYEKLKFADFTTKSARKSIFIGICMMALCQFNGIFAIVNYTGTIFAEAGSDLSPNVSAIIIGVIQIFGSFTSAFLVDKIGRKILLVTSAIGTGVSLLIFGIYNLLQTLEYNMDSFTWIPITTLSFSSFIAPIGVLSIPFVIVAEIMPEKIRSAGISLCMCLLWIFAFINVKYFPIISDSIGLYACLFFFSGFCFAGTAFTIYLVPETKGRSFDEILKLME